jgi:rod shape-determining protein MreD
MTRVLRLLALIAIVVLVQVTVFPHLRLFGVVPDLGLLLAIAIGYREGPETGAVVGFLAGFGYDLFLETPLGLCALSYALVGYAVGTLQAGMLRSPRWLPPLLGLVGGLVGGLVLLTIGVLVGVDGVKGAHGVVTLCLAAVYDMVLAPLVFWLVAKVLPERSEPRLTWTR